MKYPNRLRFWTLVGGCVLAASLAVPQQSTERYIPIGDSPGVSNGLSFVGRIVAGDEAAITIETADGERHVLAIGRDTRIWVDRSQQKLANLEGSYADCEVGRRAEVMPRRGEPSSASWIKVQPR